MKKDYPHYLTYKTKEVAPSVLKQEFPLPSLSEGEVYYPENKLLLGNFTTDLESQRFGAAQFCSFLSDTIEVEHCLVIPAIASLRRIPFKIPPQPKQDLYKIATDEGYHAEQANSYLLKLENHFNLSNLTGSQPPLFLRRLNDIRSSEPNSNYHDLITIVNGIVTETRISVELSRFANNKELSDTVREICKSHAKDEVIHSTQFQALGQWLWEEFNEETKFRVSDLFITSSIARSLPDIDSIVNSYRYVTGRSLKDSYKVILSKYDADILIKEMLIAVRPTLSYLQHKLGVDKFLSIEDSIKDEKQKLARLLEYIRKVKL